jgi:hypothetical protein
MSPIHAKVRRADQEPEGWRTLWERAQRERDPKQLDILIKRMNQLLAEQEKRYAAVAGRSNSNGQRGADSLP